MVVHGSFDITLQPLESAFAGQDGVLLGRMSFEKTFHGELSAQSRGEMLSARTAVEGAAGYVAIEQVSGSLSGKTGSFLLQHFGTRSSSHSRLTLEVVPHSGSGELSGLAGQMVIRIEGGQHYYDFDYTLG